MTLKIKTFLLVFLLLLVPLVSSGMVEGFKDGVHPKYSLYKDGGGMNARKLLGYDNAAVVLDYDDAGANQKHDPPKKKPGAGGGKS